MYAVYELHLENYILCIIKRHLKFILKIRILYIF